MIERVLMRRLKCAKQKAATGCVLYRKSCFENFVIFTGKRQCLDWSLFFNKVAWFKACNQQRYFPVNIAKFLRTFLFEHFEERLRTAASG